MAISQTSARALSASQRQLLLRHVDGAVPVHVSLTHEAQPRASLIAKGLLRPDRLMRPKETALTQDGRYALAVILADAADALVAAGILDMEVAARVAAMIKARRERRAGAEISTT